ncbi:RNA-binding S4 domain-containing protein [Rhodococcus hoagii]|nr:RNA-binding S4 domain-containing protein [Prescottella equi]
MPTPNPDPTSARLDSWMWAVRLFKTRAQSASACRSGHVRVNGTAAKASVQVKPGDEVRVRIAGRERIVVVVRPVAKRVGPPIAAECLQDNSPPPPSPELIASIPRRDRGAGRPTKRERRDMEKFRGSRASDGSQNPDLP